MKMIAIAAAHQRGNTVICHPRKMETAKCMMLKMRAHIRLRDNDLILLRAVHLPFKTKGWKSSNKQKKTYKNKKEYLNKWHTLLYLSMKGNKEERHSSTFIT